MRGPGLFQPGCFTFLLFLPFFFSYTPFFLALSRRNSAGIKLERRSFGKITSASCQWLSPFPLFPFPAPLAVARGHPTNGSGNGECGNPLPPLPLFFFSFRVFSLWFGVLTCRDALPAVQAMHLGLSFFFFLLFFFFSLQSPGVITQDH